MNDKKDYMAPEAVSVELIPMDGILQSSPGGNGNGDGGMEEGGELV